MLIKEIKVTYDGIPSTLQIVKDTAPINPRDEWGNVCHMMCWHGRYQLGDRNPYETPQEMFEELLGEDLDGDLSESEQKLIEKGYALKRLYLLDHGGITISTRDFGDPWDSGQVGIIYLSPTDVIENKIPEHLVEDILESEVKVYDDYLKGDIYGYRVVDESGEILDSCYGFYGYNEDEIIMESGVVR